MKCAGHYETQGGNGGNNNSSNGSGSTQVWVYDSLDDSTNMATATYLDASGHVQTGANCWKSMSVGSNRTLTVPTTWNGPIYLDGAHGTGSVNLQGTFTCGACTLVLTNSDPSGTNIGTFNSNAQAHNNITAPTTGTYAGIAVYQDRRASGNTDQINGGSGNLLSGIVYFPKDTLWLNGTGDAVSLCSMFIANNLKFNGTGNISISAPTDTPCSGIFPSLSSSTTIVRLVA